MKTVFLDTNVFMRYLTRDLPAQSEQAESLFALSRSGKVKLITGPPVLFEIAWTLKSFYKLDRKQIYEYLSGILGIPGLQITDLDIVEEALEYYKTTTVDFSDAYIAVLAGKLGADSVATFNRKHFSQLDIDLYPFT